MFIVNTGRWEGGAETGASEFPRLEIVNTLIQTRAHKSLFTLRCLEVRSHLSNFCLQFVLPNQCRESVSSSPTSPFPLLLPGTWSASLLLFAPFFAGLGQGMELGLQEQDAGLTTSAFLASLQRTFSLSVLRPRVLCTS